MPSDATPLFAAALGRIPSGLFILTARRGDLETGMLASWVQQCSFDPPRVSVAVHRERYLSEWLIEGTAFTLNVVGEFDKKLVAHFGKGFAPGESAFAGLDVDRPDDETVILNPALAHLRCRVATRTTAGDHDLIIATVVGGRLQGDGSPYIHVRKNGLKY